MKRDERGRMGKKDGEPQRKGEDLREEKERVVITRTEIWEREGMKTIFWKQLLDVCCLHL